jgi:hypothetical protein
LKLDKVGDPQSLNLYLYVRNSPTHLIDPTGLDFQFVGKDKEKFADDFNNRFQPAFQVKLNDEGVVEIIDKDKIDVGKLSAAERALYDAIEDTENRALIWGDEAKPGVHFGAFASPELPDKRPGVAILDSSDMSLLRGASKIAAGETVAHEMMEAYESAKTGSVDYNTVHKAASALFPEPLATGGVGIPNQKNRKLIDGFTTVWTFTRPSENISVRITFKYDTAVPSDSIVKNRAAHITEVVLVDKK